MKILNSQLGLIENKCYVILKKFLAIVLVLLICALAMPPAVVNADDKEEDEEVTVTFSDKYIETAGKPVVDAAAVVVMEAGSGRVLFSKNPTVKRSIASTTKIMTAIIALENAGLDDKVEISRRAASVYGSTIGLKAGDTYTLEDLMYGMLLNSGNDCAIAVAEYIGGTVENFANMMNSKAKEIGASGTVYVTPHGLDADGQYSTAYDLAIITRYAFKNEDFCKIVSTKSRQIQGHSLYNTNELLDIYPGADGVKTGYTGKAGRCLVASATKDGMRLISVVLGCVSRNKRAESSRNALEYGFKNYKLYTLVEEGKEFGTIPVIKGKKGAVMVKAAETVTMPLTEDEYESLEKRISLPDKFAAPIYAGMDVGAVQFLTDGTELACIPLKTWSNVDKKNYLDYLAEVIASWAKMMREGIFYSL